MHNIFEFTPNLIGILGSASFTNFKLQKKIKDLSELLDQKEDIFNRLGVQLSSRYISHYDESNEYRIIYP